jgi:predicted nucleotidyltransferase
MTLQHPKHKVIDMNNLHLATPTHQRAYDLVNDLLHRDERVLALTITGSAARNEGSFDSDLDFDVFFREGAPEVEILGAVEEALNQEIHTQQGREVGRFFAVDLHAANAIIIPQERGWTDGPDNFELEIGNTFAYSRLIFEREGYFTQAKANYTPYYEESLRQERLQLALKFCYNNLEHIDPYVKRGLYFQAFRRLYDATREFLQALFIARQVYPIAYDKWIKKQLVEILDLPDLYNQFVALYEVQALESNELITKGHQLREYTAIYVKP